MPFWKKRDQQPQKPNPAEKAAPPAAAPVVSPTAGSPTAASPPTTTPADGSEEKQKVGSVVREFLYGMAAHDMTRYALKTRSSMEHLFILITMGDLLGVPILPPYYSLRLMPYVVPQISTWKRRMLREKDLTDALF